VLQGPSPSSEKSKVAPAIIEKSKAAATLVDSYTVSWEGDVPLLLIAIEFRWSPHRRIAGRL
jgi:hypothetical protein